MPRYVIERDIPGAGQLSPAELQAISQRSCSVLEQMGPRIQWQHSYVTGDKVYCIYLAENEQLLREHASAAASRSTASRRSPASSTRSARNRDRTAATATKRGIDAAKRRHGLKFALRAPGAKASGAAVVFATLDDSPFPQ